MITKTLIQETATATVQANAESLSSVSYGVYSDREPAYQSDVLVQLRTNLAQLDDLHGRLKFAMHELSYLLKRN